MFVNAFVGFVCKIKRANSQFMSARIYAYHVVSYCRIVTPRADR